jgi:hypothetical protein
MDRTLFLADVFPRVDLLLLDGLDALYRIALAVFKGHEAELLRCVRRAREPADAGGAAGQAHAGESESIPTCCVFTDSPQSTDRVCAPCSSNSSSARPSFTLLL